MTDEPIFPKPEGPQGHVVVPKLVTPEGDDAPTKEGPPPPGADGFAVETTFFATEVIDETTGETNIEVVSGDVFGSAEAASPMMYPNLAETGFVVPTFQGSRVAQTISNLGGSAFQFIWWTRFVATKTITITRILSYMNIAAGMNAFSTLAHGIYNETGDTLLARTDNLHVNNDLGCNGVPIIGVCPLTVPTSLKLTAGSTYVIIQMAGAGRSNGMFVWSTDTTNFVDFSNAMVRFNGGDPGLVPDRFRWGLEGSLGLGAAPLLPPASITADLTQCSLQNASAYILAA